MTATFYSDWFVFTVETSLSHLSAFTVWFVAKLAAASKAVSSRLSGVVVHNT